MERVGQWRRNSETPKLLQYASPGVLMPPKAAAWAAQNFRNIEMQFVGYGLHFIQEDYPEAIGRGIVDWYRRLTGYAAPASDAGKQIRRIAIVSSSTDSRLQ